MQPSTPPSSALQVPSARPSKLQAHTPSPLHSVVTSPTSHSASPLQPPPKISLEEFPQEGLHERSSLATVQAKKGSSGNCGWQSAFRSSGTHSRYGRMVSSQAPLKSASQVASQLALAQPAVACAVQNALQVGLVVGDDPLDPAAPEPVSPLPSSLLASSNTTMPPQPTAAQATRSATNPWSAVDDAIATA